MAENIVDALIVTMGLDNSDYERGMNEVEDRTRQFSERAPRDVERGLSAIEQRFGATFQGIFRTFIAPLTAALGTMGIFSQYTQTADRIGKTAARIGASAEDLQAWGEAAKRAGGSVEGFIASFESLNSQIQRMQAMGGKGRLTPFLKQLGISATENGKAKDTFQILRDLAAASDRVGKSTFAGTARFFGLDQGTIALLQQGRVAMDELIARQRALGVYTKEDFEITAKFNDAISDLQQSFRAMAAPILQVITPALTTFAGWLTNIVQTFREHQGFIVAGLTVIAATMSGVLLKAATALGAALMPLLGPIAAVAALGAIFDEIATYAEGGETAFQGLWEAIGTPEDFKAVGKAVQDFASGVWETISGLAKDVGDAFVDVVSEWGKSFDVNAFVEQLSTAWDRIKDALAPLETAFKSFAEPLKTLKPLLAEIFGLAGDIGKSVMEWLGKDEPGGAWDLVKSTIEGISITIQAMNTFVRELFGWIQKIVEQLRKFLGMNNPLQQEAENNVLQGREKAAVISERAEEIKKENPLLTDAMANVAAKKDVDREIDFKRDYALFGQDQLAMAQAGWTAKDIEKYLSRANKQPAQETKAPSASRVEKPQKIGVDVPQKIAVDAPKIISVDAPDKIAVDVPKPAAKAKDQPSPSWWNALFSSKAAPEAAAAITSRAPDAAKIQQDNRRKTTVNVKNDTVVNNRFEGVTDGNAAGLMNDAANSTQRAVERGNNFALGNGTAAFNSGVFGS